MRLPAVPGAQVACRLICFLAVAALSAACGSDDAEKKGWGTAKQLATVATDLPEVAVEARVALDSSGNGVAVWQASREDHRQIVAIRYSSNGGWGQPSTLWELDDVNSTGPLDLAMNSAGEAVAVWLALNSGLLSVWSSRLDPASGWSAPAPVPMDGEGYAQEARVAIDRRGTVFVVWQETNLQNLVTIQANRFQKGAGWATAQVVGTDESGWGLFAPRVAADEGDGAYAIWVQAYFTTHPRQQVWANTFAQGAWGTPAGIGGVPWGVSLPGLAARGAGMAFAAWTESIPGSSTVVGSHLTPQGWQEQTIESVGGGNPAVGVDSAGDAIAAWGTTAIHASRFVPGAGWSRSILVRADGGGGVTADPRLAVASSGHATLVWAQDGVTTRGEVKASSFMTATVWSTPEGIQAVSRGRGAVPDVAVDGAGNAIAVWSEYGGSRSTIWANRYVAP